MHPTKKISNGLNHKSGVEGVQIIDNEKGTFPQLLIIYDLSTETSFLTEMTILLVGKALYLQTEIERKNRV